MTLFRVARLSTALAAGLVAVLAMAARAQDPARVVEPRRLIVHVGDIGSARSVNRAAFDAVDSGAVSSVSVVVQGPAFDDAMERLRAHPDLDVGVTLTLTSEWPTRRWGPVLPREAVPTLVDPDGMLHRHWSGTGVNPAEVEQELRAQIQMARMAGLRISHLDVHQLALYGTGTVYSEMLARIARDEMLPVLLARRGLPGSEQISAELVGWPVLEQVATISPAETPARWAWWYETALRTLPPGTSELIVHPAYDDEEMRASTREIAVLGHEWRQRELDVLVSADFRRILAQRGIRLVGWRDVYITLPARVPASTPPPTH